MARHLSYYIVVALFLFSSELSWPSWLSCSRQAGATKRSVWSAAAAGASVELRYTISEELEPDTLIANIATNASVGSGLPMEVRRTLRYKFLTPPTIPIRVDELTGEIFTSGRIDRETVCGGSRGGSGGAGGGGGIGGGHGGEEVCRVRQDVAVHPIQYFQIIKLAIEIADVNDNSPEFTPSSLRHEWLESSARGTSFVIPTARDADTKQNAVSRYELVDPSETLQLRVIKKLDRSTEVRLVLDGTLDRETRNEHEVKVIAYDSGTPPRSGSIDVTIAVLDSNDNTPVFTYNAYEVTVSENVDLGTTIARVSATDRDEGQNAQLTYALSTGTNAAYGHVFAVNDVTGEVYVIGEVDYEKAPVYPLIVTATDGGVDPVPAETTVIVKVEDVNDNAPQIVVNTLVQSDTDVAEVLENAPSGTFVGHVIVRDPDKGQNGIFNCSINEKRYFTLDQVFAREYHLRTKDVLDREQHENYDVIISCTDGGVPPLNSSRNIMVTVTDVNDNPPVFSEKEYTAELLENNYIGASIVQVTATDRDSQPNAEIRYSLEMFTDDRRTSKKEQSSDGLAGQAEERLFRIDQFTGLITAAGSFNYEQAREFRLRVTARDTDPFAPGTGDALLSTADVIVNVLDVNDERPKFLSDTYEFTVEENLPLGSEVGYIQAIDLDSPPYNQFRLSIMPTGSLSDAFLVHHASGRVVTARELDREDQDSYIFVAMATDEQNPSLMSTTRVKVKVIDSNDHSPQFRYPTSENSTVRIDTSYYEGQLVATMIAEDDDDGQNSAVVYELIKGNDLGLFDLNMFSGDLTLTRDLAASTDTNTTYNLVMTATDGGVVPSKTFAYLTVLILARRPGATGSGRGTLGTGLGGGRKTGIGTLFVGENMLAIVVVAGISVVVVVVLIAAIAAVLCGSRRRSASSGSGAGSGCCCCSRSNPKGTFYNCRAVEEAAMKSTIGTNGQKPTATLAASQTADILSDNLSKGNSPFSVDISGYNMTNPAGSGYVECGGGVTGHQCEGNADGAAYEKIRGCGLEVRLDGRADDVVCRVVTGHDQATSLSVFKSKQWLASNINQKELHSDYSSAESLVSNTFKRRADVNKNDAVTRDVITNDVRTEACSKSEDRARYNVDHVPAMSPLFTSGQDYPICGDAQASGQSPRPTCGDTDSGNATSLTDESDVHGRCDISGTNSYPNGTLPMSVNGSGRSNHGTSSRSGANALDSRSAGLTSRGHHKITNDVYKPLTLQTKSHLTTNGGMGHNGNGGYCSATGRTVLSSFAGSKPPDSSSAADALNYDGQRFLSLQRSSPATKLINGSGNGKARNGNNNSMPDNKNVNDHCVVAHEVFEQKNRGPNFEQRSGKNDVTIESYNGVSRNGFIRGNASLPPPFLGYTSAIGDVRGSYVRSPPTVVGYGDVNRTNVQRALSFDQSSNHDNRCQPLRKTDGMAIAPETGGDCKRDDIWTPDPGPFQLLKASMSANIIAASSGPLDPGQKRSGAAVAAGSLDRPTVGQTSQADGTSCRYEDNGQKNHRFKCRPAIKSNSIDNALTDPVDAAKLCDEITSLFPIGGELRKGETT